MEENYKGKVWGGRKGLEIKSCKRALWWLGFGKRTENKDFFNLKIYFEVGNESRVKYWNYRCCSEQPLCEIFLFLFVFSN